MLRLDKDYQELAVTIVHVVRLLLMALVRVHLVLVVNIKIKMSLQHGDVYVHNCN